MIAYQPAPLVGSPPKEVKDAAESRWVRRVAEIVNTLLRGKMNVTLTVTLVANAASTTVIDARIGVSSALLFTPTTAHAAAEIAAGGFYVSAIQNEQVTLTHANNAQTDRTFTVACIG